MSVKIAETCATRIKKALSIRNMTQTELCAKAKISKSSLSEYLSGKYIPRQDKVFILAQALNVDPVWLWGYDVPMEKEKTISPSEAQLTEGEATMLELFRLVPEDKQQLVLQMIRAALNTSK